MTIPYSHHIIVKEVTTIENKQPDWTIGHLYEKSWEIVKKNKVLWIFGMAAAWFGGSQYNFSNSSSDSLDKLPKMFKDTPSSSQEVTQVLGAATDSIAQTFQAIFSSIPAYFYFLLGLEILALVIFGIIIALIGNAWSQGSLIQAIQAALDNKKPTIQDASEKAFLSIKPLIWLQIVPSLIMAIALIVLFAVLIVGIVATSGVLKIIFIILTIIGVFLSIYGVLMLTLAQIWAPRVAILDQKGGKDSLTRGYRLTRKKFWSMVLLGLINTILSGIVIGLPLIIMVGFLLGGAFSLNANLSLGIFLLLFGGLLFLVFLLGYLLLSGILTAFKASIWTIAYNSIKGKYGSNN